MQTRRLKIKESFEHSSLFIDKSSPIDDGVKLLQKTRRGIILVVASSDKLFGVVTDSDVRRAILSGISFDSPIESICNTNPVLIKDNATESEIFKIMKDSQRYQLPVVSNDQSIVDIRFVEEFLNPSLNCVGFILAGGEGRRMQPLSAKTPKPLLKVGDNEMLISLLNSMIAAGIRKIYIALCHKKELFQQKLASFPEFKDKIEYILEDEPLGTAGALAQLSNPSHPVLVANADLVSDIDFAALLKFHGKNSNDATLAVKKKTYTIPFGVSNIEGSKVISIKEKPQMDHFVNVGFYVLEPSVLELIKKGQKIEMPDFLNFLIERKRKIGAFPLHENWRDVGTPYELRMANQETVHFR